MGGLNMWGGGPKGFSEMQATNPTTQNDKKYSFRKTIRTQDDPRESLTPRHPPPSDKEDRPTQTVTRHPPTAYIYIYIYIYICIYILNIIYIYIYMPKAKGGSNARFTSWGRRVYARAAAPTHASRLEVGVCIRYVRVLGNGPAWARDARGTGEWGWYHVTVSCLSLRHCLF